MPLCFEFGAKLDIIENFAVENDPQGFVFVGDRLAASAKVDDAEAGAAQGGLAIEQNAEFIRAAMPQLGEHLAHIALSHRLLPRAVEHASNPTHYFRSILLTLPEPVLGSSARNSTWRGTMNSSSRALQWEITAASVK